jgi:hypothetical protein
MTLTGQNDAPGKFPVRSWLICAGKSSLAERIEQVSFTVNPSAGFDIRSFEENCILEASQYVARPK